MGTDGAEGASTETAPVDIHRVFDHLVGWDSFVFVFGVWQPCVGEVEGRVEVFGGHGWVGWIHHGILSVHLLQQPLCVNLVRLLLDVSEILCLCLFVLQALFVRMQHQVVVADTTRDTVLGCEVDSLRYVVYIVDIFSLSQPLGQSDDGFLAHAVDDHVCP